MEDTELVDNPTPRVPVCLCLDTSGSMDTLDEEGGISRLDGLKNGIQLFYDAVSEDEDAKDAAEISIVTFDDKACCIFDFSSIEHHVQQGIPYLQTGGMTTMGAGINLSLDLLDRRKEKYQNAGVDYYQPWLVLMTDGSDNGNPSDLAKAIDRTSALTKDRKLTIFAVGIGEGADMNVLARISPKRPPVHLKGLKFREFFERLSQSISRVSQSTPGDDVPLPPIDPWQSYKGW